MSTLQGVRALLLAPGQLDVAHPQADRHRAARHPRCRGAFLAAARHARGAAAACSRAHAPGILLKGISPASGQQGPRVVRRPGGKELDLAAG